ncbi:MAG: hypothetical protein D6797_04895, partial [Bdellovibrio sp.]
DTHWALSDNYWAHVDGLSSCLSDQKKLASISQELETFGNEYFDEEGRMVSEYLLHIPERLLEIYGNLKKLEGVKRRMAPEQFRDLWLLNSEINEAEELIRENTQIISGKLKKLIQKLKEVLEGRSNPIEPVSLLN